MADYEWSFAGQTWGEGTGIDVPVVEGLFGHRVDNRNVPRLGHGSRGGAMRVPERVFTMDVESGVDVDAGELAGLLADLRAAWEPRDHEWPLTFQIPGEDSRRIWCRPARFDLPLTVPLSLGFFAGSVQWEASDPFIYSDDTHTEITARAEPGDGLAPPWTPPLAFPAATSLGAFTAANAGTWPAPWTARIDGPITDPVITNVTSGKALHFTANGGLELTGSQWVDIDSSTGEVLLGGTGDRRTTLRLPESRWFELAPGDNEILFTAAAGAGELTFTWRDCWWG